ncbi:GNAT family N-acetyltransferase [Streptococcus macacae]|uniref:Acetyltransferase, GNAT family n=1 Tax=Streptococcus macacae NCTC 11558 TaxID=764298 RepID=G5JWL5_9STRE|nr:GNAT family N-acetyltransferase [Streptococcus macacae]EHJ53362.1 acetyltransferase, GNAT family [Streptococcus macacae NCTC 11558]SUN78803.1 acetyltransferase [Streptococcus macacae NCTC 11558]
MDIWTQLGRFSEFETQHLFMRPFAFKDHEDFYAISGDVHNLEFIFPLQATSKESDFLFVHYFMKNPLGIWALEEKNSHKMIGAIRLENIDQDRCSAEVGYFINRTYCGQGLATEALQNLVYLAFEELGLKRLTIIVHKKNAASARVAEKAGFTLIRQFKGSDRYSRKIHDYLKYSLKAGDKSYE